MSLVCVMAVGDISLQVSDEGCDANPFRKVRETLANKDILFGNLECVLSETGEKAQKAVVLSSPPYRASWLKEAGFDILNLANNHIMDLGTPGFHGTLEVLREKGLAFMGADDKAAGGHTVTERNGVKFAFLGYCVSDYEAEHEHVWVNVFESAKVERDIRWARSQCDFVIISLHWGIENVSYPSPGQRLVAHGLIDIGADVIIGHHPHVAQGIEKYKGGIIAYSLGNFQFEPRVSYTKANMSFILSLYFSKSHLLSFETIPVIIEHGYRPVVSLRDKEQLDRLIEEISTPLENGTLTWRWWFEEIAGEYLSGNMRSFIIRIRKYGLRHLLQCVKWIICPFCIRCYWGIITKKLRLVFGSVS